MTCHEDCYVPLPWQRGLWSRLWEGIQQGYLPHALLLTGEEGIGKRQFADALMLALCCEQRQPQGVACRECGGCRKVLAGSHPDCRVVAPDNPGQAIRVDVIRELAAFVGQSRLSGPYRVIVIDPASAMNLNASNALLKILEEPPPGTLFLLICRAGGALPATVMSRCQRWLFPLPSPEEAEAWLSAERPQADAKAALKAVEGAPLKAREGLDAGWLALQVDFYADWERVRQRRLSVSELAGKWSTKPLQETVSLRRLLDWLFLWLRDEAREEARQGKPASWLAFHSRLQQTYANVLAVPQLNRQLVIEDVLSDR